MRKQVLELPQLLLLSFPKLVRVQLQQPRLDDELEGVAGGGQVPMSILVQRRPEEVRLQLFLLTITSADGNGVLLEERRGCGGSTLRLRQPRCPPCLALVLAPI